METKIVNHDELLGRLYENIIEELDLSEFDFTKNDIDFSNKQLEGIIFSDNKTLKNISFQNSILINCKFDRVEMDSCDFSKAKIKGTGDAKFASFNNSKIYKTKFRDAEIETCDFRYADVVDCTLQGAHFVYTDFYRTAFKGITVFQDVKIESSSLNYISFETFCMTNENLVKNKFGATLVQENKEVYRDFLGKWVRLDISKNKMSIIEGGLASRYKEAERIYRQLSALWESKGHNRDAEWAYMQGKRMERKRLWNESEKNKFLNKIKAFINFLLDIVLGYGVSLTKVICTYLVLILLFGVIYRLTAVHDLGSSIKLSLGYIIGVRTASFPAIETLSMLQTGIGMLLTGFMGFIVANKIRKS